MAKVYSWEVSKSLEIYAYIINPLDVQNESDFDVYVGTKLSGDDLNKVIEWTATCTNEQYIEQFEKLKQRCYDEGYVNLVFENVESYINVPIICDNLRGPAGKGIMYTRLIGVDEVTNISTYAIYYDDNTYDTFEVKNGKDGKDGKDGKQGEPGYDGVSSKFVMIYSSGEEIDGEFIEPSHPEGGSYDFTTNKLTLPEGWSLNENVEPPVWMSSRTFSSNGESNDLSWSAPIRLTGENGKNGVDGTSIEFIYLLSKGEPSVDNLESLNENGFVPDGWTGSPTGIDENNIIEWCSTRTYDKSEEKWGAWKRATIWSKYGVNGMDGDGVEYIYFRSKNGIPPLNPTPKTYNDINDFDTYSAYQNTDKSWLPPYDYSYVNINDDIVKYITPDVWTNNPEDINEVYQYQWLCVRKYNKNSDGIKVWGAFNNPTLWAKYGVDGKNGVSVKKIYALSNDTTNPPLLNDDDINGGSLWGMGFPTGYVAGENVVWGAETEIWPHNNEFAKSYKLCSEKNIDGNVIRPDDADEYNTLDVDFLPNEENTEYKYLRYNYEYYMWKGGWSKPYLVTGTKGDNGNPINYTSYVFGYGFKNYTPNKPNGLTPDDPGTSKDELGNTIYWVDFPDTSGNKIDGEVDEYNNVKRWYQCSCFVNGKTGIVEKWGEVYPLNGQDGNSGVYTEFRFGVTSDGNTPQLVQYDSNNNIIREPILKDKGNNNNITGWFTTSDNLPELSENGAMWQIWALVDSENNNILDGTKWNGPVRVSGEKGTQGEKGPAGERGLPGISQNQMYCLGTEEHYFGIFNDSNKNASPEDMFDNHRWLYSDNLPIDLIPIEVTTDDILFGTYTNAENLGRVLKNIDNGQYYLVGKYSNGYRNYVLDEGPIDYLYIWCIQGKDIYEGDEYKGVAWSNPFKLQGVNGLPGKDGGKGQVVYPMGVYNENEVYITTNKKAPYVIDPQDGQYYVYNIVNEPWVCALPENYRSVLEDNSVMNAENTEVDKKHSTIPTENIYPEKKYVVFKNINDKIVYVWNSELSKYVQIKYKYSVDGTCNEDKWMIGQNETPSQNYAKNNDSGQTPAWELFESFNALYASLGIIENGLIGSSVYNNEFLFSQQGINKNNEPTNDYENFMSAYKYDTNKKQWYIKDTKEYLTDDNVDPYDINHEFRPNMCINFKTGDVYASQGNIKFSDGHIIKSGFIKGKKIIINNDNFNYYFTLHNIATGSTLPAPTGGTGGDITRSVTVETLKPYLNVSRCGSYVVLDNTINREMTFYLDSLPGFRDLNESSLDEMRLMYNEQMLLVNDTGKQLKVNFYGYAENDDSKEITKQEITMDKIKCTLFLTLKYDYSSDARERIYWVYSGGFLTKEYNKENGSVIYAPDGQCVTLTYLPNKTPNSCL